MDTDDHDWQYPGYFYIAQLPALMYHLSDSHFPLGQPRQLLTGDPHHTKLYGWVHSVSRINRPQLSVALTTITHSP